MNRNKKAAPYLLLTALTLFFVSFFVLRYGVFGSKVDWLSQHSVLPDYFRQQFYDTGSLFPEFAANIGGGQNIYNFSYYGLYSPVVMFSYLLPWVKMSDYLMAASILNLTASGLLFYRWLIRRGISTATAMWTAFYFLLAAPMIFHSYGHLMFVNYMPFLCMALMGVDVYLEEHRTGLYIFGVFLMIMSSFYFSIGGMLVLMLYGVHRYIQIRERAGNGWCGIGFCKDGVRFLFPMLTAVLLSGILLVPTAFALAGRRETETAVSTGSLLFPQVPILRFVYHPYGIGLTTLILTVLLTGFTYRKWSDRLLSIGCTVILTVPVFAYLLNGGLYIRDKVMIPFLPLLCYLTADYIEKQRKREISFAAGFTPYLFTLLLLFVGRSQSECRPYWKFIFLDGIVMIIIFLITYRKRYSVLLLIVPVMFLFAYGAVLHRKADRMVGRELYRKVTDDAMAEAVRKAAQDDGFYRSEQFGNAQENGAYMNRIQDQEQYVSTVYSSTYNPYYQDFRTNTFETEQPFRNFLMQGAVSNPIYRKFMGIRDLISDTKEPGYELYQTTGNVKVYRDKNVLPIAYATDRTISEKEYLALDFPYRQTALLQYAVVGNGAASGKLRDALETETQKAAFEIPQQANQNIEIKQMENGYHICAKKKTSVKAPIADMRREELLFLQFDVKNNLPKQDISVWVHGIQNKLTSAEHIYENGNHTFTYAVPMKNAAKYVKITFGAGDYEITDVRCYAGRLPNPKKELCQSELLLDKGRTGGNRIAGTIHVRKDGYLITSIPYDKAFEVRVDGKKRAYEKVNTAFLGVRLEQGKHQIELIYHAPGLLAGKISSLVGIIFVLLLKKSRRC